VSSNPTVEAKAPASALITVIVLCFGGMSAALMQTLVIPIQTELPQLLHTSPANASWVITATLLGGAVAMPIAGRLADMFGKQRVLVASSVLLVIGSLTCALSDTLLPMLTGRVLQGLAMGFIPVGISLMREVTPPSMTNTAIASMSATLGVGGAIGLPLSAWVAEDFNWHALFWMSVGLAVLMVLSVALLVPHVHDAHGGRFDFGGAIGLAVGLLSALIAISKGNEWGWSNGRTIGLLVFGLLVLVVWAIFELRTTDPLCDLRITAQRPVLLTNLAAIAVGFGMMAQAVVVPQLLQIPKATGYGLGQTILQAGLWMAPSGLMMLLFAPVSSGLMTRIGPKRTLMIGAGVLGVGYIVGFELMNAPWQLLVASCVASAGVGIGYAAMPTLILDSVPMTEAGSAVGINGLMRSIGTSVAAAVMAALLTSSTTRVGSFELPTQGAFQLCFLVGAAAAFVGVAIAATIPVVHRRQQERVAVTADAA
jgi:MFS family permease